jgi:hypothetical protein
MTALLYTSLLYIETVMFDSFTGHFDILLSTLLACIVSTRASSSQRVASTHLICGTWLEYE